MSRDHTIVCFGEALIDFLATPADAGEARAFRQFAGGAPANAAVAIARLGGCSEFVGMLANDMFGDFLLESLREAGAGVRFVRRSSQANTALAFVSLDDEGERSFSFYRPPAADLLFRASDFDPACMESASIFHVCSNSLTDPDIAAATLAGMAMARAAGALLSVDLNLRKALWPQGEPSFPLLWQALEAADLVKLSREELDHLRRDGHQDEDAVIARLLRHSRVVVVTDGSAPMRWFTRTTRGELPALSVRPVDTTAAGDAFTGGLLVQLQRGDIDTAGFDTFLSDPPGIERWLRYASACGALAVTRHGAFAALPTHAEASALLADTATAA